MTSNRIISLSALLMSLAVMIGAFGAHALEEVVSAERLETWETAVLYHFIHALALLLIGILRKDDSAKQLNWATYLMLSGILIFSGSLYLLVLTDTSWLGAITPIGGISFIAAWSLLALHYFRK